MAGIIIGLIIAAYTGYLIYRQLKNVKAGYYCGNCSGCPSSKSCGQYKER
ncbi:MAG: FeoB-associated Cys-rich membrane protein [Clostridiales bacterium]|nr:FeoB-associated Cys-rich membrane protein [Clostridiales bacterium]